MEKKRVYKKPVKLSIRDGIVMASIRIYHVSKNTFKIVRSRKWHIIINKKFLNSDCGMIPLSIEGIEIIKKQIQEMLRMESIIKEKQLSHIDPDPIFDFEPKEIIDYQS